MAHRGRSLKKLRANQPGHTTLDIEYELARRVRWVTRPLAKTIMNAFKEAIIKGVAEDGETIIKEFGRFYALDFEPRFGPEQMIPHRGFKVAKFKAHPSLNKSMNQEGPHGDEEDA